MYFLADIRKAEHVKGRSINLALSTRGRTALRMVGLEDTVLENGIPMHARMIHDPDGSRRPILYGKEDQVRINKMYKQSLGSTCKGILKRWIESVKTWISITLKTGALDAAVFKDLIAFIKWELLLCVYILVHEPVYSEKIGSAY